MSHKHGKSRQTVYHEVALFKDGDSKHLDNGTVMVDNYAFYIGPSGNWRYPWKHIDDVEMDGHERLTIKCNEGTALIECTGNTEDNFPAFHDFVLKKWNKKQGKKVETSSSQPPSKKRRSYGSSKRSYAKVPRMSLAVTPYDFPSDDEKEDNKSWDTPQEPEENSFTDQEEENEFDKPVEDDENQTPNAGTKTKHLEGKRRLRKSTFHHDDDSDDEFLDDAALTTPVHSNRLVSPTNADDSESEEETEAPAKKKPEPSTAAKGTQSITSFFSAKPAASSKTIDKSPPTKPEESKPTTPIQTSLLVSKSPLRKKSPLSQSTPFSSKTIDKSPPKKPEESKATTPIQTSLLVSKSPLRKKSPLSQSTPFSSPARKKSPFSRSTPFSSPARPLDNDNSEWLKERPPSTPARRSRHFAISSQQYEKERDDVPIGNFQDATEEDAENTPPGTRLSYPNETSGVDRKRFSRYRAGNKGLSSQPSTPTKRSLADAALAAPVSVRPRKMRNFSRLGLNNRYDENIRNIRSMELTPTSPWRGFKNLGNTCYLNSSLQMLFSVPAFVSSLAEKGRDLAASIVSVSHDIKDTNVAQPSDPKAVKNAVDAVTDKFQGYLQRDAHEFLSDLIDRVHDELEEKRKEEKKRKAQTVDGSPVASTTEEKVESDSVITTNTPPVPTIEERKESGVDTANDPLPPSVEHESKEGDESPPFPTDEFFRMNVQVCLKCDSCGYARTMQEMYRHLSIDVEDEDLSPADARELNLPPSVQKGIDQFFKPETREIRCEKCTNGTTATQTLRVLSSPKALLLHLKRFALVEKRVPVIESAATQDAGEKTEEPARKMAVEMAIRKNKAPVVLNPTVSLGPIVANAANKEAGKDGPMATFDIKSVVHHIGSTAWSGHYTCDAIRKRDPKTTSPTKEAADTWVTFDDRKTFATTADQVLKSEKSKKTAYMLLYTLHEV